MNFTMMFAGWAVLAVGVLALAAYRKVVARNEDDSLHVREGDAALTMAQVRMGRQLSAIDMWGKTLTLVTVVAGLALAGFFLYTEYTKQVGGIITTG